MALCFAYQGHFLSIGTIIELPKSGCERNKVLLSADVLVVTLWLTHSISHRNTRAWKQHHSLSSVWAVAQLTSEPLLCKGGLQGESPAQCLLVPGPSWPPEEMSGLASNW